MSKSTLKRVKVQSNNRNKAKSVKAKSDTTKSDRNTISIINNRSKSIYKKEGGWYFSYNKAGEHFESMPFRTRELAREAKKNFAIDVLPEKVEKKYAYKVVRKHSDGTLGSASVSRSSALWKEYKPNEITEVDKELFEAGFGLCCFRTVEDSRYWVDCRYSSERELWKVEVGELREPAAKRPSVRLLSYKVPVDHLSTRDILNIINNNLVRNSWPSGCIMASSVKLVERIQ